MAAQVDLPNGVGQQKAPTDMSVAQLAQQLSNLRADIVAGKHPRFQVPEHLKNALLSINEQPISLPNGLNAHAAVSSSATASARSHAQKQFDLSKAPLPPPPAASADVQAGLCERRQELEKVLEEQIQQKKAMAKLKPHDTEIVADFDVTEMLRRAHERVKPFSPNDAANQPDSSSDSFDENTFYSSQMNSTTSTEEVDNSKSWRRPPKVCRFFRDGKNCPYGEKCTFSHDPAVVNMIRAEEQQRSAGRANEQANRKAPASPRPPKASTNRPPAQTQDSQVAKIAELEEQLRKLKESQQPPKPPVVPRAVERDDEEPPSQPSRRPPDLDEFGRDKSRREADRQPANEVQPVRVVRNTIASPHAPQPSRVSPFTVSRLPTTTHVQRNQDGNRHSMNGHVAEPLSAHQSPAIVAQPLGSKKRRRRELENNVRNVAPRREQVASPAVQIKEEPASPPLPNAISYHRQVQEVPQYVDEVAPSPHGRYVFPGREGGYAQAPSLEESRPITPQARRMLSRSGQHRPANGEPDLRRVVSTRQLRAPLSPTLNEVQYAEPQLRAVRAASQVQYVPSAYHPPPPPQYRASVQPQVREHQTPVQPRQIPISPTYQTRMAMAPPSRRIVVDQFGNRYMEAPVPEERPMSMIPIGRQMESETQHERIPSNNLYQQTPQMMVDETGRYVQQPQAPTSPQFVDYPSSTRKRQLVPIDQDEADDFTYDEGPRNVRYEPAAPARDEDTHAINGGIPNARYAQSQYDMEQVPRTSNIRPQQPRMIRLGEHREMTPQVVRQVSVRPDEGYARNVQNTQREPLYQFAPQEEMQQAYEPTSPVQEEPQYRRVSRRKVVRI